MQDLKVIGVESGGLVVASDDGERYRIAIDEVLQSRLRQVIPEPGAGRKLSPREIQAHIRSGMSAQDVASITGVPIDYIQKFEGPILAEREYVVTSALDVPVHTALESEAVGGAATFGAVIRERLHGVGGINERWASWKEQGGGWVVKLSFTADQIDHDARWSFDPRKLALAPLNSEATTLSQQGAAPTGLIPRLRAIPITETIMDERPADASRFDSGAFDGTAGLLGETRPTVDTASRFLQSGDAPTASESHQTADLLDALRRRRGEREAANYDSGSFDTFDVFEPHDLNSHDLGPHDIDHDEAVAAHPSSAGPATSGIRLVDVPLAEFLNDDSAELLDGDDTQPQPTMPQPVMVTRLPVSQGHSGHSEPPMYASGKVAKASRKGRASMPSWDDIVFGTKSDEDPA